MRPHLYVALLITLLAMLSCGGEDVPPCGDGSFDSAAVEECDDGNTAAGDGCSPTCTVDPGWECMTPSFDTSVCAIVYGYECNAEGADCQPVCGDGHRLFDERCDDANVAAGDGCSATCEIEDGWYCDNQRNWDGERHIELSTCMPRIANGEVCIEDEQCLSDSCSYEDTGETNETICIAGQGEPCTTATCPEHHWSDYTGGYYTGGCLATSDGRGLCLTGCQFDAHCPDGWECVSQTSLSGEDGACQQPCEAPSDCVGAMQTCATSGPYAGWCVGTA